MARRKRRSKADAVSAGTVRAIKARKRAFLSEVSKLLSDALGFSVRVSMAAPKVDKTDWTPAMRKASRMTVAQSRRQIADAFFGGPVSGPVVDRVLNDPLPSSLLGEDDEASQ